MYKGCREKFATDTVHARRQELVCAMRKGQESHAKLNVLLAQAILYVLAMVHAPAMVDVSVAKDGQKQIALK